MAKWVIKEEHKKQSLIDFLRSVKGDIVVRVEEEDNSLVFRPMTGGGVAVVLEAKTNE